ncbi:gamma-glutamylcyclotransferase family protein [Nocardia salmonicida]|uniref:gamma-glutamylcyclotransferase family protein n=1 Tax=Nocardia salmonicida TaxID=53431 RepID=UPI0033D23D1D
MPLFAYGTLQLPEVVEALIGRVPATHAGELPGWVAAPLPKRMYPGLVREPQSSTLGLVVTGLSPTEWMLLDRFEDTDYALERVTLTNGSDAWVYAWRRDTEPGVWDLSEFRSEHLTEYLERCMAWRRRDLESQSV